MKECDRNRNRCVAGGFGGIERVGVSGGCVTQNIVTNTHRMITMRLTVENGREIVAKKTEQKL